MPSITHTSETELLYQAGKLFTSYRDMGGLLQSLLGLLQSRLEIEKGMISVREEESDDIVVDVSIGYTDEEIRRGKYKVGEGVTGTVVRTGEPMVVPSISREPMFLNRMGADYGNESEDAAFLCVPIKIDGEALGTISIVKRCGPDQSFSRDLGVLTMMSIMIAHAVNSRRDMRRRESELAQENRMLRIELHSKHMPGNILGNSPAIQELRRKILLAAPTNSTILITGESGTGKELIANAVHEASPRRDGPYIKVNMAALPENLIESELFGHERGAFTGAVAQKKGRFELANGGTIFLDEIGDLSQHLQVKILRVIQEKTIERLGGEKTIPLDVRIIAATHRNLEERIETGAFRPDLYYRLNVFPVYSPPLRERKADIMLLADHFLEKFSRGHGKPIRRTSSEAIDLLTAYHWPGNVRELENCIERAVIMSDEDAIRSYHLPPSLQSARKPSAPRTLEELVNQYQREVIIDHLKITKGNITRAAELLGTTKRILTYRVRELGIEFKKYV